MLEHALSDEEHNQIVQTIEMFEAITRTQPEDYQSLEILKEAYGKLGKQEEALRISRRLSEAYFNVGSYTLAMQECEAVLSREPNAPDILSMLGEIESRLQASGQVIANAKSGLTTKINTSGASQTSSLIDIGTRGPAANTDLTDRGDEHLAKFLIVQQLFDEQQIHLALDETKRLNKDLTGRALATSMVDILCRGEVDRLEKVLSALIDRTKFAYVPLEYYDVDRQIAPMLPDYLTLGRLFVPFDLVSRTMMVACCNPFDSTGREAVEQSVDYTVSWYLARPSAIAKSLQNIYRLESRP